MYCQSLSSFKAVHFFIFLKYVGMKPQYTSILICTEAEYCKAIIIVFLLHIKTFREPVKKKLQEEAKPKKDQMDQSVQEVSGQRADSG